MAKRYEILRKTPRYSLVLAAFAPHQKGISAAEKVRHQREMFAAEERIAGTLASWKLFEFMFPEFPRELAQTGVRNSLDDTYRVFDEGYRRQKCRKKLGCPKDQLTASSFVPRGPQ